jgi:hypothetical protein
VDLTVTGNVEEFEDTKGAIRTSVRFSDYSICNADTSTFNVLGKVV